MAQMSTIWEYARLAAGPKLEFALREVADYAGGSGPRRAPYLYRWETHLEHASGDTPEELLEKLALAPDDPWARDLSPHYPLSILNALGTEGWELFEVLRVEEPEFDVTGSAVGREGRYYLFRRARVGNRSLAAHPAATPADPAAAAPAPGSPRRRKRHRR